GGPGHQRPSPEHREDLPDLRAAPRDSDRPNVEPVQSPAFQQPELDHQQSESGPVHFGNRAIQPRETGSPPDRHEASYRMVNLLVALMAGTVSCGSCHQATWDSFRQTAHFLSSSRATSDSIRGSFVKGHNVLRTGAADVHFEMERRGDGFFV